MSWRQSMAGANSYGVTHCRACGRIVSAGMPDGLCSACRNVQNVEHGRESAVNDTLNRLAEAVGVQDHEVRRAMRTLPEVARYLGEEATCAHCQRRPPMEGQQLCLRCQVDALHDWREAAEEAYENAEEEAERAGQGRIRTVLEVLDEKRAMTPTSRINPSGPPIIKNYRYK